MSRQIAITAADFQLYRQKLGFANQNGVRDFFGAKDIIPTVDLGYIQLLNNRLFNIFSKINEIVASEIKISDLVTFKNENIDKPFAILKDNDILPSLNNQGRRPEQVYYSWMRGYVLAKYFVKAFERIFQIDATSINSIGDDDLTNIETFRRTPKADLEIELAVNERLRIEIQSGFTGINDIKQHKVLEAKRVYRELGFHTLVVHFDLYNGQVAFIKIDEISDDSVNWISRQQMEGQTVFNIDQNFFNWKITERPKTYVEINSD